jgi:hypothetical protein
MRKSAKGQLLTSTAGVIITRGSGQQGMLLERLQHWQRQRLRLRLRLLCLTTAYLLLKAVDFMRLKAKEMLAC